MAKQMQRVKEKADMHIYELGNYEKWKWKKKKLFK